MSARLLSLCVCAALSAGCPGRAAAPPVGPAMPACGPAWMLVGDAVDARGSWVDLPLAAEAVSRFDGLVVTGTRTCHSADLIEARFEVREEGDARVVARPKVLWRRNDVAAACFAVETGAACVSVCAGDADCDRLRGVR